MLMVILHTIFFTVISQTSFDLPTQIILFFTISFLVSWEITSRPREEKKND